MKKSVIVVLALIVLVLTMIQIPMIVQAEATMVQVTEGASIRTKPGFDGDKIKLASVGSQYIYLRTEGSWYAIQLETDKIGYLPKNSCKLVTVANAPSASGSSGNSSSNPTSNSVGKHEISDSDYQEGLKYMDEGKYYSAIEAFIRSASLEARGMIPICIQAWPETGEIWHDSSLGDDNIELIVNVEQESKQATLVRIYREDQHVADLFVGGQGQAKANLPAGNYILLDGTGTDWFGRLDAFGRYGYYETLVLGENNEEERQFQPGYAYTISISNIKPDTQEPEINAKRLDWEGFTEINDLTPEQIN